MFQGGNANRAESQALVIWSEGAASGSYRTARV